ncbi:heterokaryon incompatibility protein-domain-containing protein [Corynascus novoguineensis]|uniref:Heterokaryon incompatibility protein-domain-containing protein n=1 Tax=Corynascus novoguineensis TaxID=1126955 RepID=A0AAN7HJ75_9PEZI|nr:heterokaryon incompatibility protein-domain-containing protein [Corynascus novoguineensis]
MRDFEAAAKRPTLPDFRGLPECQYRCLVTRTSIRVLRVEALDDADRDIHPKLIKVRIEEVNLDENPEFNALSYVWGDHRAPLGQDNRRDRPKHSFNILCNDQTMSVTYNLFCFLRRLSSSREGALKDIRAMPFWIDQLCIQSDNSERTFQVAIMDRVYAQARRVVSWLGESDIQVDSAVRLLGKLKDVPLDRVSQPNSNVAQFVKDIPNDDWLALGSLLSRPYFKRAWIVQEIAMAKELLIICGEYTLHCDDLAHCSAILETSEAWTMLSWYASVFRSVQNHVAPDGQCRESLHYGGQLAALIEAQSTVGNQLVAPENLLLLGEQFDATVPVDKYFAMLHSRRLFFTEDGLLGMGPESSENGDEVWEIDGLLTPRVMHRVDSGAFRYVGEAFVLGMTQTEWLARAEVS